MRDMGEFCPGPEVLAGWLEQSLPASQRARVTSHLASCDDCRRAATIASSIEPESGGTIDEVLLRQLVRGSRRRSWGVGRWVASAAAALLVAGLAFWLARPQPREAPVAVEGSGPKPARISVPEPGLTEAPVKAPYEPPVSPPPDTPAPVPEKKPDPAPAVTPKEESPRPVAVEAPAPPPVLPKESPAPVRPRTPGVTEADLSRKFGPVYLVDASGDLWIAHDGAESVRVGRTEQVGFKDTLSARDSAGAFALEGKATLALERGATATVAWQRLDQAFSLNLVSPGSVMVDTEGMAQKWEVSRGPTDVTLVNLNGRFVVDPRGDQLSTVLLAGRCDFKVGDSTRMVDAGKGAREVMVSPDGRVSEKTADPKKYARLGELRPSFFTVFSATFEKDEVRAFPYTVPAGKLVTEATRTYLHAEVPASAYPKSGEKVVASCSVRPERPILASDRIVLSFWYRSNVPTFTLRLGKYTAVYTSRLKPGEWGEGRIQVSAFDFEGTAPNSGDELPDVQFQVVVDGKKVAVLDVDGVQFLRRAK
jgi:hypothetical protein